jgi:hypothetical protein
VLLSGSPPRRPLATSTLTVLNAVEFSTADHLHSPPSIDNYVQAHFFSNGAASAEGWLHRLEGYVAEQKAAIALEKAGHVVQFAPTANNASWDLVVDGHQRRILNDSNRFRETKRCRALCQ